MTKLKSKKMTKSTFAIIIMAIAMVAMLAFGGTYAYFTATADKLTGDSFTTGTVKLTSNGSITITAENLFPYKGNYIVGSNANNASNPAVSLTVNTSDTKNYVAIQYVVKIGDTVADADDLAEYGLSGLILDSSWGDEVDAGKHVYVVEANDGAILTVIGAGVEFNVDDNWKDGADASEKGLMGVTITITCNARSIQATGFDDKAAATTQLLTYFSAV